MALVVNNLPANVGDVKDWSLIPGSGRSPGEGHGNLLQYFCLENPMSRRAEGPGRLQSMGLQGVSQRQLKQFSMQAHTQWYILCRYQNSLYALQITREQWWLLIRKGNKFVIKSNKFAWQPDLNSVVKKRKKCLRRKIGRKYNKMLIVGSPK